MKLNKPTFSGKKIKKAGECLINSDMYEEENRDKLAEALDILSLYRYGFVTPLENALSKITFYVEKEEKSPLFSKRLKRHVSIVRKLQRFPQMNLKNMQDIGGCRVIVSSNKKVYKIVKALKRMPEFKLEGKYRIKDYIEVPKPDGYRSYHIVGKFFDDDKLERRVEIQIRTRTQHYWATSLEIVDLFTQQSLKSNEGKQKWKDFFKSTSKIFAELEKIPNFHNLKGDEKGNAIAKQLLKDNDLMNVCDDIVELESKLKVTRKLEAFASSLHSVNAKLEELDDEFEVGYVLLIINVPKRTLTYSIFGSEDDAEDKYKEAEKHAAIENRTNRDSIAVALVYAQNLNDLKAAYPNFFADSSNFLENLNWITKVRNVKRKTFFQKILGI